MSLMVRPSSKEFGWWGVFQTIGENRARELYTCAVQNECYDIKNQMERNPELLADMIYLTKKNAGYYTEVECIGVVNPRWLVRGYEAEGLLTYNMDFDTKEEAEQAAEDWMYR